MGGIASALFGGPTQSVDVPETTPAPLQEAERDPEAKAVRDTERRRLLSRRAMGGTLLSQGQGKSNILGRSGE